MDRIILSPGVPEWLITGVEVGSKSGSFPDCFSETALTKILKTDDDDDDDDDSNALLRRAASAAVAARGNGGASTRAAS